METPCARPRLVRAAALAALVTAASAGLIVAANYLGLADGFADPRVDQLSSDPSAVLRESRSETNEAAGLVAAMLLPQVLVATLIAGALWRGRIRRAGLVLLAGGFAGACGLVGFGYALVGNPLGWGNQVDHHMVEIDVPWYPPLLSCLVLGGLAAQLVMLAALFRRTTAEWLSGTAPAATDGGVTAPA